MCPNTKYFVGKQLLFVIVLSTTIEYLYALSDVNDSYRNIYPDSTIDDDASYDRHSVSKKHYNVINLPPSPCNPDTSGTYGDTRGENIITSFQYEMEVNKTILNQISSNSNETLGKEVLPAVDSTITKSLISYLFSECANDATDDPIASLPLKGISSKPDDTINDSGCASKTIDDDSACYRIDSRFSMYSQDQRRGLQEGFGEIINAKELILNFVKQVMNEGKMNNAHRAIIGISFVDEDEKKVSKEEEKAKGIIPSSLWWQIPLGIVGGSVFVANVVVLLQSRNMKTDIGDEDDTRSPLTSLV